MAAAVLFVGTGFFFPYETMKGVGEGLRIWYQSVLPSLFPFMVGANVLIALGAVRTLGYLLEPVMRPLFNVPGCGAFAWMMGMVSGYPMGAKIVADLRVDNQISQVEAQRLLSFCNNSGPMFMVGFVGASALGNSWAGYLIVFSNYLSALCVGFLFRFYKRKDIAENSPAKTYRKAAIEPVGKILGDSIRKSIDAIVQVGGFIVLFCVLIRILNLSGITSGIVDVINPFLSKLGIENETAEGFISGLLEITNGIKIIGNTSGNYMVKVALCGGLVAFGGLSIFAQSMSFLSKTDIKPGIFFFSKILQGLVQTGILVLCFPFFETKFADTKPVMAHLAFPIIQKVYFSFIMVICILLIMAVLAALSWLFFKDSGRNRQ